MGAHRWYYFAAYQPDIQKALDILREREFRAGRYNPVTPFPDFPISGDYPGPGARHSSIQEAVEASDADGTRSILDINRVANTPDYCTASPFSAEILHELYGTHHPTKETVLRNLGLFDRLERGQGKYLIVYKDAKPSEIFFVGYSFD